MTDWTSKSLAELKTAYAEGRATALEVVTQYCTRIKSSDLNAFIEPLLNRACESARRIDKRRAAGEALGSLAGIPVAIKDNLATDFAPTTCASKILAGYMSPYNATVVNRLTRADAIFMGKTNLDEFAMGSSNENSSYGPVRNPYDERMIPGGSSGGSAAAVSGRLCCTALGSDTGGSVRQPAALSGCVGMKPTYGHVSRYGLVAFASSLDQIGPIGRCVSDVAAMYDIIAGPDELDSTSIRIALPNAQDHLKDSPGHLRIGVISESRGEGVSPEIREALERIAIVLKEAGHELCDVSLPSLNAGISTYYIVANAEASANLARYDGVKYGHRSEQPNDLADLYARTRGEGFGAEVKRRIMLGTYVLSAGYYDAYYLRALKVRNRIREEFTRAFAQVDFLLSPTTPQPAFPIGSCIDDPLSMYLCDVFTVGANLAGLPALSLPVAITGSGLPIGAQLWGARGSDHRLLQFAHTLEELVDYQYV